MITKRLLELRNSKGFSQKELSKRLGIARTTYAGYENGSREPDFEMMRKISDYYNIEISSLIGESKKETAVALPKSKLDLAVERIETDLNITITDDPMIMEALENYIQTLGNIKKKNQGE